MTAGSCIFELKNGGNLCSALRDGDESQESDEACEYASEDARAARGSHVVMTYACVE